MLRMLDSMNTRTNKILFVIGSLHIGGAENQLLLLATELVRRGRQVLLFSLENDGPLKAALSSAGVHVRTGGYDSRVPRWRKILLLIRAQWRLFLLAATSRPQVLHAYLPLTNLMGAVAGRAAGVRMIITSRRALGTHQDRHPWWPWFDRIANRLSTVITANSRAVVEDTLARDRVDEGKIRLIYNGLRISNAVPDSASRNAERSSLGLEDRHIAIVCVANLIPYKGHFDLIEAFAALHAKYPDVRLFLVGEDRGIASTLTERMSALGIGSVVQLLGRRADVWQLLSAMDVGVMASHEEGFSNALLEKLAAGLPVVATDVGGNGEALADMPDCVLVKAKDAVDLSCGLEKVVANVSVSVVRNRQRREMVIARYATENMVERHEAIYGNGAWGAS